MNENKTWQKEEVEIDIKRIIDAVLKRIWMVAVSAVVCAFAAFLFTFYAITPKYTSSAMFYVNNSAFSLNDAALSITSSDLAASKGLVDSYIVILNTRATLNDVADYANISYTYSQLVRMISAESVNGTEIFRVSVTCENPEEAEAIANAIAYVLPKKISNVIEGTSAKVVEYAIVASSPSSPSYTKNVIIAFMFGLVLSAGLIALREMFDLTIRNDEDIIQSCKYPILAEVPNMNAPTKGGYYTKNKKKKSVYGNPSKAANTALFGEDISFAASEAYKLLRTKLQFSFADENDCHVICTTSALAGEGKSLSSINIAYSMAQLDKKVILIDCDLRRPSIATKIGINKAPGLSDYLTRHVHIDETIQPFTCGSGLPFDVISAGRIPPNPIELLSSERMVKAVTKLKAAYDYIILDLPPVEEVSDALVAAKLADGILLVVRQDYCNRNAVEHAVKQLEFVNAKVLGVIFNATSEGGGLYKKYYSGKYYGKKYYNRYESSYENSANAAKKAFERRKLAEEAGRFVRKRTSSSEENKE